ncbi:MAG TPA: hypothetical protein VFT45_25545 [Longimicrobium sp.]|nr:hypothetical protein [Longimicrobium sp.]
MKISTLWRGITFLAIGTLLASCDWGDATSGDVTVALPAASGPQVTATSTVVFQITGLAMIVPPLLAGDDVHVVLPKPKGVGDHAALLGFGIPREHPVFDDLCVGGDFGKRARRAGICYVDLTRWTLGSFGGGGQPPTTTNLPPVERSGLLNVTVLAGGLHRVYLPRANDSRRAGVAFRSGELGPSCKLARWRYRPVDATGTREDSLANVVTWRVGNLVSPQLVFTRKSRKVTVDLLPGVTGVLLAHVPTGDRKDLPPGRRTQPGGGTKAHFNPYYDLLSRSAATGTGIPNETKRRPPLQLVGARDTACEVVITTISGRSKGERSVATYACMVAAGERGS